jgi:predicted amidohydrolase
MVVDPWGECIASAGEKEAVVWAEIDPGEVKRNRSTFPVLKDRVF